MSIATPAAILSKSGFFVKKNFGFIGICDLIEVTQKPEKYDTMTNVCKNGIFGVSH
jgi:hypothetical protein